MKLKFKHQDFQQEAAQCVIRAFAGQPYEEVFQHVGGEGNFRVYGFGNAPLRLERDEIAANVRSVQREQNLAQVAKLESDGVLLTVEMETGTGKTYTYIKTIYELNKQYGWNKFVVVVPSVAIREGVYKSLEIMSDHFAHEYGKRIQYFIYNSKQLNKIDSFASDNNLHIMIINMQAFNTSLKEGGNSKDARIIFSQRDEFGSKRPIDLLAQTNPILIIDEPQSVLGANAENATRKGIKRFNPLFQLLYSATHREVHNMVYRLDAIDAYNKKLVKKIEVKGIRQVGTTATNGYVYLEEIVISKENPRARLSFDRISASGHTTQVTKLVREGDNLFELSGKLAEYENNYIVQSIDGVKGDVRFLNGLELYEGDAVGSVTEDMIRRTQIRETIKTHLERESMLFARGIKVLSLFFIDHVENYRMYDPDNNSRLGKYAQMFEEEYEAVIKEENSVLWSDEYRKYLARFAPAQVHNGYFSKDNKGKYVDSKAARGETGSNDENAYDLIMKDKERLLSFAEPTRFIFSHSALKEGWDNPNVFQICTLKNSANELHKRQEVGRGMRLCVNEKGERQDADVLGDGVFDTNILTVIASESYDDFSRQLQNEIADLVGDRPLKVTPALFQKFMDLPEDRALPIYNHLLQANYIDDSGQLTEAFLQDKVTGRLYFGDSLEETKESIVAVLEQLFNPHVLQPENARKRAEANFRRERFDDKAFQELWECIKVQTSYMVDFKSEDLVKAACAALDRRLEVTQIRLVVEGGEMNEIRDKESLQMGTAMKASSSHSVQVDSLSNGSVRYDLIGRLVEITGLTRNTVVGILKQIKPLTFEKFYTNPEEFIRKAGAIINEAKAEVVVENIVYSKTSNSFDISVFTESMPRGILGVNAIESIKSLYNLVVVDSVGIEKHFAQDLEKSNDVEVYTKLPRSFYINTPMGHYTPDWAIVFREGSIKHIYFIVETKGVEHEAQLRIVENAKIICAERHFAAISNGTDIIYTLVTDYNSLLNKAK